MEEAENRWRARGRVGEDLNWSGGLYAGESGGRGRGGHARRPSQVRGSVGVGVGVGVSVRVDGLLTGTPSLYSKASK